MAELSENFKEQAKQELLGLAENVSNDAADTIFNLIELAIKDSKNKFDDMLLPAIPKLREVVKSYIDEIKK